MTPIMKLMRNATIACASLVLFPQTGLAAVQGCVGCAKAAVVGIDSIQSCQTFSGQWGGVINCNYGWQGFREMLETAMANSRKLQVVERAQVSKLWDEQELQSWFRTAGAKWRYTITGSDYLIYGNITEIGYEQKSYGEQGYSINSVVGTFGVDVKFVETRTGKIFYSSNVRVVETLAGDTRTSSSQSSQNSSLAALYGKLQRQAAEKIAAQLATQVFPIKILRATGKSAILNYGSAILKNGMTLDLLDSSAGDLVDPDTGRVIKGAGAPVGTMVVTSTNPDFATVTLRSGNASAVVNGARLTLLNDEDGTQPDTRVQRADWPE